MRLAKTAQLGTYLADQKILVNRVRQGAVPGCLIKSFSDKHLHCLSGMVTLNAVQEARAVAPLKGENQPV